MSLKWLCKNVCLSYHCLLPDFDPLVVPSSIQSWSTPIGGFFCTTKGRRNWRDIADTRWAYPLALHTAASSAMHCRVIIVATGGGRILWHRCCIKCQCVKNTVDSVCNIGLISPCALQLTRTFGLKCPASHWAIAIRTLLRNNFAVQLERSYEPLPNYRVSIMASTKLEWSIPININ